MTAREAEVAAEIRRVAEQELQLDVRAADGEELASRLDSLALLSLVVAVEDRFRVVLDDSDAAGTRSLEDLARLVCAKMDARSRQADSADDAGAAPGEGGAA